MTCPSLLRRHPAVEVVSEAAEGLRAQSEHRAARLVQRLREAGPLLLVLDECHHLLEVWGQLLRDVLAELPDAFVLGLTATPPDTLTEDQKELVDELFGDSVFTVSIPAVVREGDLAPFAELAWLTTPTARENDWLAEQGERIVGLQVYGPLPPRARDVTANALWLADAYTAQQARGLGVAMALLAAGVERAQMRASS